MNKEEGLSLENNPRGSSTKSHKKQSRRKRFLGVCLGQGIRIFSVDFFRGRREIDDVDHRNQIFVENGEFKEV